MSLKNGMARARICPRPQPAPALVLFLGALVALSLIPAVRKPAHPLRVARRFRGTVRALGDAIPGSFGTSQTVRLPDGQLVLVRCAGPSGTAPELGQDASVAGTLHPLGDGHFDATLAAQGIAATLDGSRWYSRWWPAEFLTPLLRVREHAARTISSAGPSQSTGLARAILLGDRRASGSLAALFRHAGLSHVMAVSGTHLGVVVLLVTLLVGRSGLPRQVTMVVSGGIGVLFACFTGAASSTLRAVGMFLVVVLMFFCGRRRDTLQALGVAGCALLALNPQLALQVGFRLSVAAVIGITVFLRGGTVWVHAAAPALPDTLASALAVSVAAQLTTLPIAVLTFGSISTVALLANLLVGTLVTIALAIGCLGIVALEVVPPLGHPLFALLSYLCGRIIAITDWCVRLPQSSFDGLPSGVRLGIATAVAAGAGVLYIWWPLPGESGGETRFEDSFEGAVAVQQRQRQSLIRTAYGVLSALVLIILVVPQMVPRALTDRVQTTRARDGYYFLDVGQGDATLIKQGTQTMLIDTGPDPQTLVADLRSLGVTHIDTLALTHTHEDHIGGAEGLNRSFGIRRLIVADGAQYVPKVQTIARSLGVSAQGVRAGDAVRVGPLTVRVVWPKTAVDDPSANENCLVLDADESAGMSDRRSALITGDAESPTLGAIEAQTGYTLQVDVLKVGHHGSNDAVSPATLAELHPTLAVISVGPNSYGHPTPSTLRILAQSGVAVRRTDRSHTVFVATVAQ